MRKISFIIKMALVFAILLAGCTSSATEAPMETEAPVLPTDTSPPPTPTEPKELVKVSWATAQQTIDPNTTNVYLAEYLGFNAEEGLTLEFQSLGSNQAVFAAVGEGAAEFGIGVPSFMIPIVAQGEEIPLINFYEYTYPFKWDIAVSPDSPVTELSQLEGMIVGVPDFGVSAYPVGQIMLQRAGLDPETDVEWIAVGRGATAGAALDQGDIDALAYWDTGFGTIEQAGIEFRILPRPEGLPQVGGLYFAAPREYLDEHPDIAIGFGRGTAKSTIFCLENLKACAYALIQMYPELAPQGQELCDQVESVAQVVGSRAKIWAPYDPNFNDWGYILESEWVSEVEFLGLENEVTDVKQFFTNEFIEEINNFDQEAIKEMAREYDFPCK